MSAVARRAKTEGLAKAELRALPHLQPATCNLLHLLQTTDSAFPVGGFAHSYGLEGMVQAGIIDTPSDLEHFLLTTWLPTLAHIDFPLVRLSAASIEDVSALRNVDELATACRPTAEGRKAQHQMGTQRLQLVASLTGHPRLQSLAEKQTIANWPVVWGVETAALGLSISNSLIAYGYQSINGILAASAKLIRIGPTAIQHQLARIAQPLQEAIEASASIGEEDIGWFSPLLDIAGACHETAYTRLFIS